VDGRLRAEHAGNRDDLSRPAFEDLHLQRVEGFDRSVGSASEISRRRPANLSSIAAASDRCSTCADRAGLPASEVGVALPRPLARRRCPTPLATLCRIPRRMSDLSLIVPHGMGINASAPRWASPGSRLSKISGGTQRVRAAAEARRGQVTLLRPTALQRTTSCLTWVTRSQWFQSRRAVAPTPRGVVVE
jgi:hypothetical protein